VRVYLTPGARDSLADISAFLRRYSPSAAASFRKRVYRRARQLSRNPELGRMVPEYEVRTVRELIEGDYRIWYRLYEDHIEVLAIFHGARDV
jgi:plasmid stabilization system protein ParE